MDAKSPYTAPLAKPSRILTWNANGLASRSKLPHNVEQINEMLQATKFPALVCIQEARLKCNSSVFTGKVDRSQPLVPSEIEAIDALMKKPSSSGKCGPFHSYEPLWSLANGRTSGTLTLISYDLFPSWCRNNTVKRKEAAEKNSACSVDGAIELLLQVYNLSTCSEMRWLVHETKQSILATESKKDGDQKVGRKNDALTELAGDLKKKRKHDHRQTCMKKFFAPKCNRESPNNKEKHLHVISKPAPNFCRYEHHEEGRVQFIRFEDFDVLHTYVPNNGVGRKSSLKRRRVFDLEMRYFLKARLQILKFHAALNVDEKTKMPNSAGKNTQRKGDVMLDGNIQNNSIPPTTQRPLLWVGDLNVARSWKDGTHHQVSCGERDNVLITEYWADEAQSVGINGGASKKVGQHDYIPLTRRHPHDKGTPGFTTNERTRFEETISLTGLKDVWRESHASGVSTHLCPYIPDGRGGLCEENPWHRADYTWRGSCARGGKDNTSYLAKYQGKAQRIDYFLMSDFAFEAGWVSSCDIMGYGEYREGFFCGSDHCASLLVLNDFVTLNNSISLE